jgi:uroporphyrinogen III methyltransferase/synthase
MNRGIVYIAGAGCGDYDLMTVKLEKLLKTADCIVYDRLINENMLNLARKDAELIYLGKENTEGGLIQDAINRVLVEKAKEGKKVLRLKGGHPFVFGRGGEEALALEEEGLDFEIVPGITSSISVPAYAGIPVSHRGINTSFHIFTGHTKKDGSWIDFETVSKLDGTLVFLMGVKNLSQIVQGLVGNGKSVETPIAIIESGSTTKQRTITGVLNNIVEISEEKKVVPPAVIVVGEVVSLREKLKWFEKKRLFGKNILVTRNVEQAGNFSEKIRELGGESFELPFIDIVYREFVFPDLSEYSAVLFNSANAVRGFFRKLDDARKLGNVKVGAVGIKTHEELVKNRIIPDFIPEEYRVDILAKKSAAYTREGDKVLIVTSDISPVQEDIYSQEYSRKFEKLVAYETKKIKREKSEVERYLKETDIVSFLSSSTFEAFWESIEEDKSLLEGKIIASIGPMTSRTIREAGVQVDIEAREYTVNGIIEELKKM